MTWLNIAEVLGDKEGQSFRDVVIADLEALTEHCFDMDDYCFYPAINDSTRLYPENTNEGIGYCDPSKLRKVPAEGLMFLSYTRAYKVIGIDRFLETAVQLAEGMGWGDLKSAVDFESGGSLESIEARDNTGRNDACALFGLLD